MKQIILVLSVFLFSFLSIPAPAENIADTFSYVNKKLGAGIRLPKEWEVYTSRDNASRDFKSYFKENKKPDESPLFVAVKRAENSVIRFDVAKNKEIVPAYKEYRKIISAKKVEICRSVYSKKRNIAILDYREPSSNVNVRNILFQSGASLFVVNLIVVASTVDWDAGILSDVSGEIYFLEDHKWKSKLKNLNSGFVDIDADGIPVKKTETSVRIKPVFFDVRGARNHVYLLGSLHFGREDFYPLPAAVEDSFSRSKNFVCEEDFSPAGIEQIRETEKKAVLLPDGSTLESVLPADEYRFLAAMLSSYNANPETYRRYRPEMIPFMTLISRKLGYDFMQGFEMHFLKKSSGKKISGLETHEFQLKISHRGKPAVFDPVELEKSNKALEKEFVDFADCFVKGDENAMIAAIGDNDSENEVMLYSRNRSWAEAIRSYLKEENDYFIVVGVKHLVGEKSVMDLLRKSGCTVL
jgi:uncharacterized protein YbaP (TraB family)